MSERVQEILHKRRYSLSEDENVNLTSPIHPNSNPPSASSNQQHQQQIQQPFSNPPPSQQQQHVFLPPTSPAIQAPRSNSNMPAPSPIQNYYAQSPGFTNFGSPAISHSSPGQQHQQQQQQQQASSQSSQHQQPPSVSQPQSNPSVQQPLSVSAQSPSGFMSPANNPQQQNYSIQSPANFGDISLQSPLQPPSASASSVPIKSPFPVGPSPNTNIQSNTNPPSTTYGFNNNRELNTMSTQNNDDLSKLNPRTPVNTNTNAVSNNNNNTLFQNTKSKFNSAALPIYLPETGFLKMMSKIDNIGYSPLEIFIASFHLKKILLKMFQTDTATVII
jgi:hypothetical protein